MSHLSYKILDDLCRNKENNEILERLRIVRAAAEIIREDIKKMPFHCESYPDIPEISSEGDDLVPETLNLFTSTVRKKRLYDNEPEITRRCLVINKAD